MGISGISEKAGFSADLMKSAKPGIRVILLLFLAFAAGLGKVCAQEGDLKITIRNIRSDSGLIRLALYSHEVQFPHEPGRRFEFSKKMDADGNLNIRLTSIPHGEYAISILDDEDGNDRMKFNVLRIPREGFGFSNNVKPGLKSPRFEECAFILDQRELQLEIEVQYYLDNTE